MQGPSLFTSSERVVLSVSELTGALKDTVESAFDDVWVEGELSNFTKARSGHCYFTLKDDDARIRCVMWKAYTQYVFFDPHDGMQVRVHGHASLYEPRGNLQLMTRSMRLAGEGALQQAFEALKRTLDAEGLFDPAHKQVLPTYPERIGIVTSGAGAALHDILSVLERRFPQVHVLVHPVAVQGMGAADDIAAAIETFNREQTCVDVLIVGRGGGSVEDLWAFNEEVVARAIYASDIPVVSAVGHETDHSIADLVADRRAATPSMAAELVVPDRREVAAAVEAHHAALYNSVHRILGDGRQRIHHLIHSYGFRRPADRLRRHRQELDSLVRRLDQGIRHTLTRERTGVDALRERLRLLDPSRPLQRGYARVERDGHLVRRASDVAPADRVTLIFHDGKRDARIEPES